jgi:hypothetical protein
MHLVVALILAASGITNALNCKCVSLKKRQSAPLSVID